MSSHTPVAITGLGAVCGAGLTLDAIWDAVLKGRSGIRPISQWDASQWPVRLAAEVDADNRTLVPDRKLHKSISRTDMFGLFAADAAIQHSGLLSNREKLEPEMATQFNDRTGVFCGAGGGNYRSNYEYFPLMSVANRDLEVFGRELGSNVNPMWLLQNLPNNVLCHVGIRHGFKGTNGCVTNQCTGGILAVCESAAAIRYGEADRMVAVGHDRPLEPETLLHYYGLGLLTEDTLRPFDARRAGTVFGEGAGAMVLESADAAKGRQAAVFGQFLGSGCVSEGTGILDVRPDGDGVKRAIQLALKDAGIQTGEVGMIVAHGNGTRASDASEARAIHDTFGPDLPPVTGFKWTFGHSIAASGVIDLALAVAGLRAGIVPGIASLEALDPELNPFPVSTQAQKPRSNIALVICRGFGGMNVAVVIRS